MQKNERKCEQYFPMIFCKLLNAYLIVYLTVLCLTFILLSLINDVFIIIIKFLLLLHHECYLCWLTRTFPQLLFQSITGTPQPNSPVLCFWTSAACPLSFVIVQPRTSDKLHLPIWILKKLAKHPTHLHERFPTF